MMGMRMSQLSLKRCSCYHEGAEAAEDSLLLLLGPILYAPEKRLGWRICCCRGDAAGGRAVRDDTVAGGADVADVLIDATGGG